MCLALSERPLRRVALVPRFRDAIPVSGLLHLNSVRNGTRGTADIRSRERTAEAEARNGNRRLSGAAVWNC
jgi:hypothetical protein